jgi:predicted phage tail protein
VPLAPEPPGKCAAVFAIVKDDKTALIRWTRPIDHAASVFCGRITHYKLLVSWTPDDNPEAEVQTRELVIEEDTDSYEVPNLECCMDYRFQVTARNVSGWGELSDPCPVVNMPSPVPPVLPQPNLRRATHHSVVIQWQHPPSCDVRIDSFRFRYTTSPDWSKDVEELHDVAPNLSQFTIEHLKPGKVYRFQVRALNKYGMGIWSDSSIPIHTLDGKEPSKIKDVFNANKYKSFITLRWPPAEANGFDVTRHLLRFSHRPDLSEVFEIEPAIIRKDNFDTCDLRHLQKMVYYFQVAAFNKMGMSEWSDPLLIDLAVPMALEAAHKTPLALAVA